MNRRVAEYLLDRIVERREEGQKGALMARDLNSMLVRSFQWCKAEEARKLSQDEVKAGYRKPAPLDFELVFSDEQETVEVFGHTVSLYADYKKVIGIK
jgi:hypothetical protein